MNCFEREGGIHFKDLLWIKRKKLILKWVMQDVQMSGKVIAVALFFLFANYNIFVLTECSSQCRTVDSGKYHLSLLSLSCFHHYPKECQEI